MLNAPPYFYFYHHEMPGLSSMQLDGSQTLAKNGGEHIACQGRKAAGTTNAQFFCNDKGMPLSMATSQSGNHYRCKYYS